MLDTPLNQGSHLTVTTDWFVPITFNTSAVADPATDAFSSTDLHAEYFDQLDLQVWRCLDGQPITLVAECFSPYINVDHLYFTIPQDGQYAIRVEYMGTTYDVNNNAPGELDYATRLVGHRSPRTWDSAADSRRMPRPAAPPQEPPCAAITQKPRTSYRIIFQFR